MTWGKKIQVLYFGHNYDPSKMQDNTNDPLDCDKRRMQSKQYDVPPPPDGGTWNQLHKQVRNRSQSKQMTSAEMSEKSKTWAGIRKSTHSWKSMNMPISKESKVKCSKG